MLDDVKGASGAARRAVALSPQLARSHVVQGFTSLAELKNLRTPRHRSSGPWRWNPTTRWRGSVLGWRRSGEAGLRQDARTSKWLQRCIPTMRSFAAISGRRISMRVNDRLSVQQLESAKTLDPSDPTAFYYDAIRKETLNRPVEALQDLEKSIALNDNRAVYRSRFLLDDDVAVRGARLGRIYRDLGFENIALLEGWKSLHADPGNASAHRLLADSYLALPDHEIARDSELLQSQLLQAVNINPVQPALASNGIRFLGDPGVASVGFNEFTRMFAANRVQFVGDGVTGTQDALTGNFIASGLFDRVSFSVGTFHDESSGIRDNNDRNQNIHNAFFQVDASQSNSVQVEVRWTDLDRGDPALFFNPENFSVPTARAATRARSVSEAGISFRHTPY